jgi:hypothetical protein
LAPNEREANQASCTKPPSVEPKLQESNRRAEVGLANLFGANPRPSHLLVEVNGSPGRKEWLPTNNPGDEAVTNDAGKLYIAVN